MVLPVEPEFEQALSELTHNLGPLLAGNPAYKKAFEIIQIPERVFRFRIVWEYDQGQLQISRGYCMQVVTASSSVFEPFSSFDSVVV
ncbi:Glutamate dehydrogenase [Mycena venus]|uniref:Glutamate dehydrogenase n=1 Tax=Mycena venus TaxID=2733690 RepID=A0A8H7CUE8_9AGAR|nr:Glutamate dehydrogenase [Mycena venus]